MKIVLGFVVMIVLMAMSAAIWAWPLSYCIDRVAHVRPTFWATFKANVLASLSLMGALLVVLVPFAFLWGVSRMPMVLLYVAGYALYTMLFRLFLKTPTGERIQYKHAALVLLLPVTVGLVMNFIFK